MKNEFGLKRPLCTYKLNWARRTSWWWWDEWDDTGLQTQHSKFKPWRSKAELATSQSQRLSTILNLHEWAARVGFEPATFQTCSFNYCTRPPALTGPGKPPEDDEMTQMNLPSRHRIRNSNPGGPKPSTLPLGLGDIHTTESLLVGGGETFSFVDAWRPEWRKSHKLQPGIPRWTNTRSTGQHWRRFCAELDGLFFTLSVLPRIYAHF